MTPHVIYAFLLLILGFASSYIVTSNLTFSAMMALMLALWHTSSVWVLASTSKSTTSTTVT